MPPRTFVSLDLETTGLDIGRDRITEVGMVRFTRDSVQATYSQLVNPHRDIPLRVQQLTSIAPADVADAPHFNSIRLDIEDFLADATIVGQNIGFDLSVLARADLIPPGDVLDTLELARLIDPGHRTHSLAALAQRYHVAQPSAHRALADAETARAVFLALYDRAEALPNHLIAELIALADGMSWSPATLLRDIAGARDRTSDGVRTLPSPAARLRPPSPAPPISANPASATESGKPPRLDAIAQAGPLHELALAVLAAGDRTSPLVSPLSNGDPASNDPPSNNEVSNNQGLVLQWEQRPEQVGMTRAVAQTLESGGELLVEAGTGTGKSLAYLIPALLRAMATGARAVVSTNTINLQEQLIEKDVPAARRLLRDTLGDEVAGAMRVTALKGRRNYLCRRRVQQERSANAPTATSPAPSNPAVGVGVTSEAGSAASRLLARLIVWLQTTDTGDRSELRVSPDEESAWSYFSAEGEDCLSSRSCPYVRDGSCFLLRARRRAEGAHVIVANHALLLSDMAIGGGVLPPAETLIIDEGHHLEDAATQHLGASLRVASFTDLLERVHRLGPRGADQGVVGATRAALAAAGTRIQDEPQAGALIADLQAQLRDVPPAISEAAAAVEEFFIALRKFAQEHARSEGAGDSRAGGASDQRLRLTRGVRAQPAWSAIESGWDRVFSALRTVDEALTGLEESTAELAATAARYEDPDDPSNITTPSSADDLEGLAAELATVRAALGHHCERTGDLLTRHDAATVTWLDSGRRSEFATLHAAPLEVGELLADGLFAKRRASVVTGATLTVDNTFEFIQERLGLADAATERFGSPFDYRRAVRLLLPRDMPEPSDRAYQPAIEESLIELALASQGRALALFTSHGALRAAARGVRDALEAEGIVVLAQGVDGSPARILNALREHPRSLVLGTAALWEGVDIPGDTVSLVVIARLPFAVPSDPVYAARSDQYEDPFGRYAVPQAITRFRQGFGRLIRRKDDRGVVVVLDGRITSKRYGESFVRSLPPVTIERLPRHALAGSVEQWLASE
ncbi:MAG: DNA polymerase-3 subunit epsilon/ATP-dependent DNA helicase DinG [Chloroflexi bacterium]|nr:MAG: DNA polymerase-3 subunit epsilon/ATP-dependent DNA helicase DinG [Chloroflexota bacterium]